MDIRDALTPDYVHEVVHPARRLTPQARHRRFESRLRWLESEAVSHARFLVPMYRDLAAEERAAARGRWKAKRLAFAERFEQLAAETEREAAALAERVAELRSAIGAKDAARAALVASELFGWEEHRHHAEAAKAYLQEQAKLRAAGKQGATCRQTSDTIAVLDLYNTSGGSQRSRSAYVARRLGMKVGTVRDIVRRAAAKQKVDE